MRYVVTDIEWVEEPDLRDPVAVLAFEGWNDAADAASKVLYYLMKHHDEIPIAQLDLEPFINYQVSRPLVSIDRTVNHIHWPATGFFGIPLPDHVHDLVLVLGDEPHHRWRRFCAEVAEVLLRLGVRRAVALGAFAGEIPHTLPIPIFGTSNDPDFALRMGIHTSTYEGPTGITGVITTALADEGIDATGIWAGLPHYLAGNPSPTGARALLFALGDVIGRRFDVEALDVEVAVYEALIRDAVAESSGMDDYIQRLERESENRVISRGDSRRMVEDIERFLRNPD